MLGKYFKISMNKPVIVKKIDLISKQKFIFQFSERTFKKVSLLVLIFL